MNRIFNIQNSGLISRNYFLKNRKKLAPIMSSIKLPKISNLQHSVENNINDPAQLNINENSFGKLKNKFTNSVKEERRKSNLLSKNNHYLRKLSVKKISHRNPDEFQFHNLQYQRPLIPTKRNNIKSKEFLNFLKNKHGSLDEMLKENNLEKIDYENKLYEILYSKDLHENQMYMNGNKTSTDIQNELNVVQINEMNILPKKEGRESKNNFEDEFERLKVLSKLSIGARYELLKANKMMIDYIFVI